MAANKNQHFVPRCYLRPFTMDEGDAAIHVFNLDRRKLIPNAPVKNQCSEITSTAKTICSKRRYAHRRSNARPLRLYLIAK